MATAPPPDDASPQQGSREGAASNSPLLNVVGESPVFQDSLRLIKRVAQYDTTVLILGETGTGKELAARAIHYLGNRRGYPFIALNCGAIPDTLMESELFGHVQGAFTDAKRDHPGAIAQAAGGTLFLDEVEALTQKGQVTLLRFLQDREYRPIGGTKLRHADVRVIAASNADLHDLMSRRVFRQDLLFRLNVLCLQMPPLRERGYDVILLVQTFLNRLSSQYPRLLKKSLHPGAISLLLQYDWPGNVRELENLVAREFLLTDATCIACLDLQNLVRPQASKPESKSRLTEVHFRIAKARAIAEFERAYLSELLLRTQGNISRAARLSGKDRSRLGKLVKKYGLERAAFAPALDTL